MRSKPLYVRMKFDGSDVVRIAVGCMSCCGARNYHEDSFGFSSVQRADVKANGFTAIVCDGMGGLGGGAQISDYTVSAMLEMQKFRNRELPVHIHLSQALKTVNQSVITSGMKGGTTAALVFCLPRGVYWCTVGDSRIYLSSGKTLTALNEDSDYLNCLIEQVISGDMTYDDAGADSKRDSLAEYIGCKNGITPDVNINPFVPKNKDKILICSDGVYNALAGSELSGILAHNSAGEAADLIEAAVLSKRYANQDNFTAIVLEFIK